MRSSRAAELSARSCSMTGRPESRTPSSGTYSHLECRTLRRPSRSPAESSDIPLAALDRCQNVSDPLSRVAPHRATASARAESETGRLRSWTGNTSISSRPNSARVSSIRPEARISRFPSAGSISTRMSMSDPEYAVPRDGAEQLGAGRACVDGTGASHVEAELHHVAVSHHVVLALDAHLAA